MNFNFMNFKKSFKNLKMLLLLNYFGKPFESFKNKKNDLN